jgi:hypothetical protein
MPFEYGVIRITDGCPWRPVMTTPADPKWEALHKDGALNSHPEKVRDELFLDRDFFDARDLVQVKYEMLRRVQAEGYQARDAFKEAGLSGLIPKKRGPRGGHKLTEEVMTYLLGLLEREGSVGSPTLVERIRERFGFTVHRRTIERALARKKKRD